MGGILRLLTAGAYGVLVLRAAAEGDPWPAVIAGGLFTAVSVLGFPLVARRSLPWRAGYVLLQLVLGVAAFAAAGASVGGTLLLVVLAAQGVLLLPTPGAVALVLLLPFVHAGMEPAAGLREGLGLLLSAAFAAAITWLLRREQATREQLAGVNAELARLAAQAEELATAKERNRVARDIHDGLGHNLTVLQMQIKAARALLPAEPGRAGELLGQAEEQALEALSEVRRSVAALRGPRRDLSLREAVERLAAEVSASGPPTEVEVLGRPRPLAAGAEEALFRTAQEGLTNVRKHAGAHRARVLLDYRTAETVRIVVDDDGRGPSGDDGGYGLRGLGERLADLGGAVAFTPGPGRGSTLTATVPG